MKSHVKSAIIAALILSGAAAPGCSGGGSNVSDDTVAEDGTTVDKGIEPDGVVCVEGEACDDGDPCTENDTCTAGVCSGSPVSCDDGLFCNGAESCDPAAGGCQPGTAPVLDDGVECTVDECDEDAGMVVHAPDHAFCVAAAEWSPCFDYTCDSVAGCTESPNTADCDDGNPCTQDDVCDGGGMCSGTPKPCDDAQWCNGIESCDDQTGECIPGEAQVVDDGVECTVDACDEDQNQVTHTPDDAACDDGNPCTQDSCSETDGCDSVDLDVECDDADPCTFDDVCAAGACVGTSVDCSDGAFCNGAELCDSESGECLPGEPPAGEEQAVKCINWACDEDTDAITYFPDDALCSDGLWCSGEEWCDEEQGCQPGVPPDVDDLVACTVDGCVENLMAASHEPSDILCDDGNWCNGSETCDVESGCLPGVPQPLDDGVGCTVDTCDEDSDAINHSANAALCDDGVFCNGPEGCDPANGCVAGSVPVIDDDIECTADACDEEDDVVVHTPVHDLCTDNEWCTDDVCVVGQGCTNPQNAIACDDLDPCTLDDECLGGSCVGIPKTCNDNLWCNGIEYCDNGDCTTLPAPKVDDGVACTVDVCDEPKDVVTHTPTDSLCDDGKACTQNVCDPVKGCQTTNLDGACDDKEPCTLGDKCVAGECVPGVWTCENCTDGKDNNGDGAVDCCDALCKTDPACVAETACDDGKDNDCDTAKDCDDSDCKTADVCIPDVGELVITEIMANPKIVTDELGEWFEVYNASAKPYDLAGMVVTGGGTEKFTVATPLTILPGQAKVFGRNADSKVNGGVTVDYAYSGVSLVNTDDELALTFGNLVVDKVVYSNAGGFVIPNGASIQLDFDSYLMDNAQSTYWCASKKPYGAGDFGTPGADNLECVEKTCDNNIDDDLNGLADCKDPSCQGVDLCPEFECFDGKDNDGDGAKDCADKDCAALPECLDSDGDGVPDVDDLCPGKDDTIDLDQDGLPDLCEVEWAGDAWPINGSPYDNNADIPVFVQIYMKGVTDQIGQGASIAVKILYRMQGAPAYTEAFMSYNKDMNNNANDEYMYTVPSSATVPGGSLEVTFNVVYLTGGPAIAYNNMAIKDQAGNPVPLLFPITTTALPPQPGQLVVTEIMYDPKGTVAVPIPDSAGEWFELYNTTDSPLELNGLQVTDGSQSFMVSPVGGSLVILGKSYLVFGNNSDQATNGGVKVNYKYPSGFQLANSSDSIIINAGVVEIDKVNYKPGQTGWPSAVAGSALELSKNHHTADNNAGANWCNAVTVLPGGDKGTPGGANVCAK